ncbi:hypothetical protein DFH09DRAFT_267145 [Mycena vulgaris]|nr:hypothetical protein DFH09DRAFT_267145 [Mycena vulgaris]
MNRINFKAIARHPVARAVVLLSVPYGCLALRVRDLDRRAQIREENIHRDLAEIRAIIKSTELDEKLCQIQEQLDGLHEQFKGIHEA